MVDDRSEESGSSRKLFLLEGDNGTGKTSYLQKLEEWADQQEHLRFISNTGNTMGNTGVAFSTFSRLFLDIFPNTTKGSFFMGANTSSNRSWQDQVLHVLVSILLHFLREARSQPDGLSLCHFPPDNCGDFPHSRGWCFGEGCISVDVSSVLKLPFSLSLSLLVRIFMCASVFAHVSS